MEVRGSRGKHHIARLHRENKFFLKVVSYNSHSSYLKRPSALHMGRIGRMGVIGGLAAGVFFGSYGGSPPIP